MHNFEIVKISQANGVGLREMKGWILELLSKRVGALSQGGPALRRSETSKTLQQARLWAQDKKQVWTTGVANAFDSHGDRRA